MQRRDFVKNISAVSALSLIPAGLQLNFAPIKDENIIKPKRLNIGDTLGLIAPGGFISEKELDDSIKNLELLGFKIFYTSSILAKNGYLAGTDKQRADDINLMFSKKEIKGIVCARGGYGCSRILPLLDYELIKNNPKVLLGYSDITALCYAIFAKTGLICFHGPVGISTFNEFSVSNLESVLVNPTEELELISFPENVSQNNPQVIPIRNGKATGRLAGGNLSIVVSLIGTPYDIDMEDKIVFLEEIGEEPYRIDRMLTQMIEAGKFKNAKGIALGLFEDCEPKTIDPEFKSSFSLMEVLYDRLYNLGIPVIYGLSFGHIKNKFTLPVGIKAELNVDNQTIKLLEPACR